MSRAALLVVVALLAVAAAACGGEGGGSTTGLGDDADPAARRGEALAQQHRCTGCHTVDGGSSVGPTWQGLAGSERTLADGRTVVADIDYLARAITDPQADVVDGFTPIMGSFAFLADDEVDDLVAYIEALPKG